MEDRKNLPHHLAIIMDGNGRWAQKRKHGRFFGHIRGAQKAKSIVSDCVKKNIKNLTLFVFSNENWLRPPEEVQLILKLLEKHITQEEEEFMKQNIQFHCIGELDRLPKRTLFKMQKIIKKTKQNKGMKLIFAFSYSGRQEITNAVNTIIKKIQTGRLNPKTLTEKDFSFFLQSSFLPDPDLIIRTSGEHRLSNFFLWQVAYSEIYISEKYWPDFSSEDLDKALEFFSKKERRFGKISQQIKKRHASVSR